MPAPPDDDVMYRFLLPHSGVRGALVRLGAAWREVAGRADYPPALRSLLGETLVASALLTGNIKLDGAKVKNEKVVLNSSFLATTFRFVNTTKAAETKK